MNATSMPRCVRSARNARGRIWSTETAVGALSSTRKFSSRISLDAADIKQLFLWGNQARPMLGEPSVPVEAEHHAVGLLARRKKRVRDEHRDDRENYEDIQKVSHLPPFPLLARI